MTFITHILCFAIGATLAYHVRGCLSRWAIRAILRETEKFKNEALKFMEDAQEEVKKRDCIIEKQNHLIEMLKMRLRDK